MKDKKHKLQTPPAGSPPNEPPVVSAGPQVVATPTTFAATHANVQLRKMKMEVTKLVAEVAHLRRPYYLQPPVWISAALAVAALLTAGIQCVSSTAKYDRAAAEAARAEALKLNAERLYAETMDRVRTGQKALLDIHEQIERAKTKLGSLATTLRAAKTKPEAERMRDIDVAAEAAELTRLGILQEAGEAILEQAKLPWPLNLMKPPTSMPSKE